MLQISRPVKDMSHFTLERYACNIFRFYLFISIWYRKAKSVNRKNISVRLSYHAFSFPVDTYTRNVALPEVFQYRSLYYFISCSDIFFFFWYFDFIKIQWNQGFIYLLSFFLYFVLLLFFFFFYHGFFFHPPPPPPTPQADEILQMQRKNIIFQIE